MSRPIKLPTLLVVTENPSIRFWVKKHLDDSFFVLSAERWGEAVGAVDTRLDFIIVDSACESFDPIELCSILSQKVKKQLVPILLITGRLKKSFRDRAAAKGVTDFLSDQLDPEELKEKIALGEAAANAREKTSELRSFIPTTASKEGENSLKNKLVLGDKALKLIQESKEKKVPVALLLLRIDRLDFFEAPEEIIKELSDFIRALLREKDVLFSTPDQRVVVLLSNMKVESACLVAEKLRAKIEMHTFSFQEKKLTTSIAVSSFEASEQGLSQMIQSATKSLKAHSEKNTIISMGPEFL